VRVDSSGRPEGLTIHLRVDDADVELIDFGFFDDTELALVMNVAKRESQKPSSLFLYTQGLQPVVVFEHRLVSVHDPLLKFDLFDRVSKRGEFLWIRCLLV
jgi:hypothetical protein